METLRTLLVLISIAASLTAFSAPAIAHENSNHGTIKVHDDASVDPPQRNQPHVSCDFWIEGFNMAGESGWLVFSRVPPTENPAIEVLNASWSADSGSLEDGWHFLPGPFNFSANPGHYRVEAFLTQGHPGNESHFAKTKTFWVNSCGPALVETPCPPGVSATAESDGDVRLEWDAVENATQYRVYRAVGEGELEDYAWVPGDTTAFTDTDTVAGETYTYIVTAAFGSHESEICEEVTVTAIPLFPSALVGALAGAAALASLVVLRRR